jgi:hypothetical protein
MLDKELAWDEKNERRTIKKEGRMFLRHGSKTISKNQLLVFV